MTWAKQDDTSILYSQTDRDFTNFRVIFIRKWKYTYISQTQGWSSCCYKILQYQKRSARTCCAIVSAVTERPTGSGHSEINTCLTKTNIKVVLIPWKKFFWIIYKRLLPTSQKAIRLHCKQQLVKYIDQNKTG